MKVKDLLTKKNSDIQKKKVRVHWDSVIRMFIIYDIETNRNLEPSMSLIDLLIKIKKDNLQIVDYHKTQQSMYQSFTDKEQIFFFINHEKGIDLSSFYQNPTNSIN